MLNAWVWNRKSDKPNCKVFLYKCLFLNSSSLDPSADGSLFFKICKGDLEHKVVTPFSLSLGSCTRGSRFRVILGIADLNSIILVNSAENDKLSPKTFLFP